MSKTRVSSSKSLHFACPTAKRGHFRCPHYRRPALCRVPNALGKGYFALGKAFAECSTRQKASGKKPVGKEFFVECLLSGIRQSLCRVPDKKHPAKKSLPTNFLPEALCRVLHPAKALPSAAPGKGFAECKVAFVGCIRHPAKRLNPVVLSWTQACGLLRSGYVEKIAENRSL